MRILLQRGRLNVQARPILARESVATSAVLEAFDRVDPVMLLGG